MSSTPPPGPRPDRPRRWRWATTVAATALSLALLAPAPAALAAGDPSPEPEVPAACQAEVNEFYEARQQVDDHNAAMPARPTQQQAATYNEEGRQDQAIEEQAQQRAEQCLDAVVEEEQGRVGSAAPAPPSTTTNRSGSGTKTSAAPVPPSTGGTPGSTGADSSGAGQSQPGRVEQEPSVEQEPRSSPSGSASKQSGSNTEPAEEPLAGRQQPASAPSQRTPAPTQQAPAQPVPAQRDSAASPTPAGQPAPAAGDRSPPAGTTDEPSDPEQQPDSYPPPEQEAASTTEDERGADESRSDLGALDPKFEEYVAAFAASDANLRTRVTPGPKSLIDVQEELDTGKKIHPSAADETVLDGRTNANGDLVPCRILSVPDLFAISGFIQLEPRDKVLMLTSYENLQWLSRDACEAWDKNGPPDEPGAALHGSKLQQFQRSILAILQASGGGLRKLLLTYVKRGRNAETVFANLNPGSFDLDSMTKTRNFPALDFIGKDGLVQIKTHLNQPRYMKQYRSEFQSLLKGTKNAAAAAGLKSVLDGKDEIAKQRVLANLPTGCTQNLRACVTAQAKIAVPDDHLPEVRRLVTEDALKFPENYGWAGKTADEIRGYVNARVIGIGARLPQLEHQ